MNYFTSQTKSKPILTLSDYKQELNILENDYLEPYVKELTNLYDRKLVQLLKHEKSYFVQYEYLGVIFINSLKREVLLDPISNYIPLLPVYTDQAITDLVSEFINEHYKSNKLFYFMKRDKDNEIDFMTVQKKNKAVGGNHFINENYYFVYLEDNNDISIKMFPNLVSKSIAELPDKLSNILNYDYKSNSKCISPDTNMPYDSVNFKFNNEKLIFSCFVHKQSYWIKEWRERYLIITEKKVYTFKNNNQLSEPTMEINLSECYKVSNCQDKTKNVIKVYSDSGEYKFQTRSQAEALTLMKYFSLYAKNMLCHKLIKDNE